MPTNLMHRARIGFISLGLCAAPGAFAHAPYLDCFAHGDMVACQGGFSDGSSAFGVHITMLSYDDEALFKGRLDKNGRIRFAKPEGEYYVRFDAGPGHELELDYRDIRPVLDTPGKSKDTPGGENSDDAAKPADETKRTAPNVA